MNYEPTINGLTKKAARQLGDAYHTIYESFEIIDSMAANSAASAHIIAGMSKEISEYNRRTQALTRENEQLKKQYAELREFCVTENPTLDGKTPVEARMESDAQTSESEKRASEPEAQP